MIEGKLRNDKPDDQISKPGNQLPKLAIATAISNTDSTPEKIERGTQTKLDVNAYYKKGFWTTQNFLIILLLIFVIFCLCAITVLTCLYIFDKEDFPDDE